MGTPDRDEQLYERPDGDVHPMMMLAFVDSAQPPTEHEVEARLKQAGFAPAIREDFPAEEGDFIWQSCWNVEGHDAALRAFVGPTRGFQPWRSDRVRWGSEAELNRAKRAKWVVGVESVQAEHPCEFLHFMLRAMCAAAGDDLAAVIDDSASRTRGGSIARSMAACSVPPGIDELIALHFIGGDNGFCWVHTHGMRAYGAPNIEILGLRSEDGRNAETIIKTIAGRLIEFDVKTAGETLEFGDNLSAQLREVSQAVKHFEPDLFGGSNDHDEHHDGWRLIILDPAAPWPPKRAATFEKLAPRELLAGVDVDPLLWFTDYETQRQSSMAKLRFPEAAMAFFGKRSVKSGLLVKLAIPANEKRENFSQFLTNGQRPKGANQEHMWFEVSAFDKGIITAKLTNTPGFATFLKNGQQYKISAERVTSFQLWMDGKTYEPDTIEDLNRSVYVTDWTTFQDEP